jgi:L-fucose mutarotase
MLKNIPSILSPGLLKTLCEMGHGDEIVLGDANFPAKALGARVIQADGHGIPELLDAILQYLPLDGFVDCPVGLMDTGDPNVRPPIWQEYSKCILRREGDRRVELVKRFAFYERARAAYAVVATGEIELYASVILKKGVVAEQ